MPRRILSLCPKKTEKNPLTAAQQSRHRPTTDRAVDRKSSLPQLPVSLRGKRGRSPFVRSTLRPFRQMATVFFFLSRNNNGTKQPLHVNGDIPSHTATYPLDEAAPQKVLSNFVFSSHTDIYMRHAAQTGHSRFAISGWDHNIRGGLLGDLFRNSSARLGTSPTCPCQKKVTGQEGDACCCASPGWRLSCCDDRVPSISDTDRLAVFHRNERVAGYSFARRKSWQRNWRIVEKSL
jgi:hypothetical protein